jgi:hypothetical protein
MYKVFLEIMKSGKQDVVKLEPWTKFGKILGEYTLQRNYGNYILNDVAKV